MATYSKLATAIISLATASFERDGFGIPAFFAPHRYSEDRVTIVTADSYETELPAGSAPYEAAKTAFAQPNGLSQLYIGRVEADAEIGVSGQPVQNGNYKITIEVNDGDKLVIDYTEVTASPTESTVLTGIKALIDADPDVSDHVSTSISGTGSDTRLVVSPVASGDFFVVSDLSGVFDEYTATETAAQAYSAISQENDAFYFVTTSDKTPSWITELASEVNAREKQFWVTVSEEDALSPAAQPATDTLGILNEGEYLRVVAGYHQDAETTFPEVGAVAYNASFLAGSIVWGNDVTSGIAASQLNGINLTVTQKQNLLNKNAFFWDTQGGQTFVNSDVKTSSGERPENVRGKDNMVVDIQASVSELLLNQVGRKLPYNNKGIALIEATVDTVLQTYVQRGFIEGTYRITSPDARLIAAGIKATQKLDNMTFVAQLQGAITMVDAIRGVLQLDEVLA